MRTGVIIQARMGSTRLPGKVLLPLAGQPALARMIERMKRSRADLVGVATTAETSDDGVAEVARAAGALVYRGEPSDVLSRYIGAAREWDVDVIVRMTADCPLADPSIVNAMLALHELGDCDHGDVLGVPDGMGGQIVSLRVLEELAAKPDLTAEDREHVTLYLRRQDAGYRVRHLVREPGRIDDHHWSVDTWQDYRFVAAVFDHLYPTNPAFTFGDVLDLLAREPGIRPRVGLPKWDEELIVKPWRAKGSPWSVRVTQPVVSRTMVLAGDL